MKNNIVNLNEKLKNCSTQSYLMNEAGLYLKEDDGQDLRICQPFKVEQVVYETINMDSLRIQFLNRQNQHIKLVIKRSDLIGNNQSAIKHLLDNSFEFDSLSNSRLQQFKEYLWHLDPDDHCFIVTQPGLQKNVFIQPDLVIGSSDRQVHLEIDPQHHALLSQQNSAQHWRETIASLGHNNPLIIFAISLALSPVLVKLFGLQSFGVHLWGKSSSGKSILGRVTNSVWGDLNRIRSWNMSQAGLEQLLRSYRDTFIVLDEISEVPLRSLSHIVYQLGNGLTRTLANKHSDTLTFTYFSSGEEALSSMLSANNTEMMAGHQVRQMNFEISSGGRYGLLNDLHQRSSPGAFMEELDRNCRHSYGAVIVCFLEKLLSEDIDKLRTQFNSYFDAFIEENRLPLNDGISRRIARQLCLCGFTGELATQWGLTGWNKQESSAATQHMYSCWQEQNQGFSYQFIDQVTDRIEMFLHKNQKYILPLQDQLPVMKLAPNCNTIGFKKVVDQRLHYFILAPVFTQQILRGLQRDKTIEALKASGILLGDPVTLKPYRSLRLPARGGSKVQRIYQLVFDNNSETIDYKGLVK